MNFFIHGTVYLGSFLTSRFAEQGLAHTLGVTTMRHGTNPLSWISIHLIGFQPFMGDSKIGGDKGAAHSKKNAGKIYLAGDVDDYDAMSKDSFFGSKPLWMWMRAVPRLYAILSTSNLLLTAVSLPSIGQCLCPVEGEYPHKLKIITSLCISLLVFPIGVMIPTIKVRIDPEKIKEFSDDEACKGVAYYTDKPIYPHHIGIGGTIWNGFTFKVFSRVYKNPKRCLTGIAMMSLSIVAASFAMITMPHLLVSYKASVIAGVILGII